jgi:hypothetical protein
MIPKAYGEKRVSVYMLVHAFTWEPMSIAARPCNVTDLEVEHDVVVEHFQN